MSAEHLPSQHSSGPHVEPTYFTPLDCERVPADRMTLGEVLAWEEENNIPLPSEREGVQKMTIIDPQDAVTNTLVEPAIETIPVLVDTWIHGNIDWGFYQHNELRLRTPLGEQSPDQQRTMDLIKNPQIPTHGFYKESQAIKK